MSDSFVFMWVEERVCPSSGAFWIKNASPKKNCFGFLTNWNYLSCQEINHALALPKREGQASLHVWESKLATVVLPRTKKVGVGDGRTASEVGVASVEVGVRFTQSLQMTRQDRDSKTVWKAKTQSGCNYSNGKECRTLWPCFLVESIAQCSSVGGPPKSFSTLQSNYSNNTVAEQINMTPVFKNMNHQSFL